MISPPPHAPFRLRDPTRLPITPRPTPPNVRFSQRRDVPIARHLRWARDWPRHPLPRLLAILAGCLPCASAPLLSAPAVPPRITVRQPPRVRHAPPLHRSPIIQVPIPPTLPGRASTLPPSPRTLWLAKIVQAEAGDQPFVTQLAVAAVILNRIRSGIFPHHVLSVILQPGQFQPVSNGTFFTAVPTAQALAAARTLLHGGPNPAPSALYFFNPSLPHTTWMNTLIDCVTYGAMQFCAGPTA